MKLKNIFYHHTLLPIGGIETFMWNMAKMFAGKYDITVVYRNADPKQIERLSKYVRCIKFAGQEFECEKLFLTYDTSIIEKCKADYYAQVIHADYKLLGARPNTHPKIDEYIAVSETVAASWKELTGITCKVIYNPIALDEPRKVLRLISATRMTKEKGKERMEALADMFTAEEIPFQWICFTSSAEGFKNPNIIKAPPRLDLIDYIADADYLVQLSSTEGYCYSVNEALNLNVPVIVTDLPTFREGGLSDGVNGYLLPLDMKDVDVSKIYNHIPKYKHTPKIVEWEKQLAKGKSDYVMKKETLILVEATDAYKQYNVKDKELMRIPEKGERFYVDGTRIDTLTGANRFNAVFVIPVEEPAKEADTPAQDAEATAAEAPAPKKKAPAKKTGTPSKKKAPASKKEAPPKKTTRGTK